MQLTAQPYVFTAADQQRIEAWGYDVSNVESSIPLDAFLQQAYPNFDLATLLDTVEQLLPPTTPLPIGRQIQYDSSTSSLLVWMENAYTGEADAMVFKRQFTHTAEGIFVEHIFCVVPASYQKQGLIKRVFQASLQQYVNMGLRKITVHAGLSAGGYVWARHGFVAVDRTEVFIILKDSLKQLSTNELAPVETVFDRYYSNNPTGRAFPMILWASLPGMKEILRGSDWHGELDLHNAEQFRNFTDYVSRP